MDLDVDANGGWEGTTYRGRTSASHGEATHRSYEFGVICALDVERAAIQATLDEEHGRVQKVAKDDNAYIFGRIGAHDVVVACLPAGLSGKASATAVARDMIRSFPIKVGLMVGICGGVWSEEKDIRLGDVVVSQPDGKHGGVVQWDYGKMEKEGVFRRTGTLNTPPRPLLSAIHSLKAKHILNDSEVDNHLQAIFAKYPRLVDKFGHQGQEHDMLFEADYPHDGGATCVSCDRSRLCNRPLREDVRPRIHYGNVASGDEVVKHGPTRDRIAREEGILCFEMEAAGLMDTFPCVVIRGVCDYADSHKNKRWQAYAAATAACYAKELLGEIDPLGVERLGPAKHLKRKRSPSLDLPGRQVW
jgi:nucleoside phosphorylase